MPDPRSVATPSIVLEVAPLPRGFQMRGHGHGPPHLCVVLSGGISERHEGRSKDWGGDWLRISGPGTEHELHVLGSSAHCLIIEFPETLLPDEWNRPGSAFIEAPQLMRMLHRDLAPLAGFHTHPSASSMTDEPDTEQPQSDPKTLPPAEGLALECRLSEILARLSRTKRLGREFPVPTWLTRIRERLDEEADSQPSLVDLAQEAGIHPSHLARAFRDHFGVTMGSHVRAQRLRNAYARLVTSTDSLSDIAVSAGFSDQAHFTRAFSSRWGTPPGRYRRDVHGSHPSVARS